MYIKPVKTPRIELNDSLNSVLDKIPELKENTIVAITSKVISICEGRYENKSEIDKYQLIKREADFIFPMEENPYNIYLTIKNGILIPSAGIDESNTNNVYIMYPADVWKSAEYIWIYLREKYKLKNLGIIITDSHTTIMRRGVTGICLSWCGFSPLYSYINKPDLYNRALKVTQVNIVDALATSAVFLMGEGNEQTPIAIIEDIPRIKFLNRVPTLEEKSSICIEKEEDLYYPILNSLKQ